MLFYMLHSPWDVVTHTWASTPGVTCPSITVIWFGFRCGSSAQWCHQYSCAYLVPPYLHTHTCAHTHTHSILTKPVRLAFVILTKNSVWNPSHFSPGNTSVWDKNSWSPLPGRQEGMTTFLRVTTVFSDLASETDTYFHVVFVCAVSLLIFQRYLADNDMFLPQPDNSF